MKPSEFDIQLYTSILENTLIEIVRFKELISTSSHLSFSTRHKIFSIHLYHSLDFSCNLLSFEQFSSDIFELSLSSIGSTFRISSRSDLIIYFNKFESSVRSLVLASASFSEVVKS